MTVVKPLRRLREDESGVASTVGTIMALLVFLTFLSLIVNQYVPVWMKDTEASHMTGAFGQFGTFKGSIDLQMLAALMAQNAGVHFIPITTFSPVTLGVDGIPIFTSPTLGDLNSFPEKSTFSTQLTYSIRGVNTKLNETSAGRVSLDVFNRYYIPQSIIYENGAVIRAQSDGQAIRADPTFEVDVVNNSVQVSWTHVSLFGQGSASGTTTEGIHSKLLGVDRQDYASVRSDVWINGTTPSGVAWIYFFNRTLGNAFNVEKDSFKQPGYSFSQGYLGGQVQSLGITTPYYRLTADYKSAKLAYDIVVQIYNDPDNNKPLVMPITAVRIQHAFVNIAIAEKGTEVQI